MASRRVLMSLLIALIVVNSLIREPANTEAVDVNVLSPENLNDTYGNRVDKDSNITFVDVPANGNYKSQGKTPSDIGAIGAFYDMANSIVGSSLPGEFPYDLAKKIKDGKFDIGNDWKKIAVDYLGYIIALAVGIVFFIVFPIVGMCFCCCRCCGRCGGKRIINNGAQAGQGDKCGRFTAMGILSAFTTLALLGSILMFVTNSNLTSSIKDFHDNDVDKIDDVGEFFNFTIYQAELIILGNFQFTLSVLFRDLDNIGFLLGIPTRELVLKSTGLGQLYVEIDDMESDARKLLSYTTALKSNKQTALKNSQIFKNFTVDAKNQLDQMAKTYSDFNNSVPNRNITTSFDASKIPDEDLKIAALTKSLSQGTNSITAESKQKLNDIPERIQNETLKERNDLKNQVNSYTKDVSKITSDLRSMKNDVMKGIDFDDIKDKAKDYTDKATEYDKYRWYGGLALSIITMINGLLIVTGVLFGLFGGSFKDDPTKRGKLSNAGGNMLFAGVIITFMFGWLVMLVTTVVFVVGAPVDKFVCGAAQDLSVFDKLVDDYKLIKGNNGNGTWLGNTIYSGKSVALKLSDMMKSCRNGKTVYSALKMEEANVFNLSEVADYNKKFSIQDELAKTVVNFGSINATTDAMMAFITLMKDFDSTMQYNDYHTALNEDPVQKSETLLQSLNSYILTLGNGPKKQEFQDIANNFTQHINNYGKPLMTAIDNIQVNLKNIKSITQAPNLNLSTKCDNLKNSLRSVEQNLPRAASDSFTKSKKNFVARLTGIMDSFIDDLNNAIKNKVGNCQPLWNLYSDMAFYGICRSTIGSLNGWWCATGWTIFSQTMSIVAAVKLSKHFRKMRYTSDGSVKHSNGTSHPFQNKVYHSDTPGDSIKSF